MPKGATVLPNTRLNDMTASMTPPPPPTDTEPPPVASVLRPAVHWPPFDGSSQPPRPWRGVPPPPPYDEVHPGPTEPVTPAPCPSAPLIDLTSEPTSQEVDRQLAWAAAVTRARTVASELQRNLGLSAPSGPPPPRPPLPPAPPGYSQNLDPEGRFLLIKESPLGKQNPLPKAIFIPKAYRSMTTSKGGSVPRPGTVPEPAQNPMTSHRD